MSGRLGPGKKSRAIKKDGGEKKSVISPGRVSHVPGGTRGRRKGWATQNGKSKKNGERDRKMGWVWTIQSEKKKGGEPSREEGGDCKKL